MATLVKTAASLGGFYRSLGALPLVEIGFDRSIVFNSRLLTHNDHPTVRLTLNREKQKQPYLHGSKKG